MQTELLERGHPKSPHSGCARGYGTDSEGRRHCCDCCQAQDLANIRRAEPIFAYLSADGNGGIVVSNWPSMPLMKVAGLFPLHNRWAQNGCMSDDLRHIRAIDKDGPAWYGRGLGVGMSCRLRPTKATEDAAKSETPA
jgi:hypothetical protein